jgi:hypothetical protein
MSRSEVFRFRLTPEEQDRLAREAADAGLSKADLIRRALGWDGRAQPTASPAAAIPPPVPKGKAADPKREPGKAAIEELAKRIHGGQGLTMRTARARAKKKLEAD